MQQDALIELEPIEGDGISKQEEALQSEAALKALEETLLAGGPRSKIKSVYALLLSKGYAWRLAAWVAWESLPPAVREPRTLEQFATQVLGLRSARVVYTWKQRHPELQQTIEKIKANQFLVAREEVIDAVIEVARQPDYKSFKHQQMVLTATGDISTEQVHRHVIEDERDLRGMSYEELLRLQNELTVEKSTRMLEEIDTLFVEPEDSDE